ncbi:glutamate ligase domain-containing protein [Pleionea litopenaei]|uniref:glutamate ligase domain-containing protein n=1 Tax=Pleionea litopenaei TaxID=3070815 RepID=UPI003F492F5B
MTIDDAISGISEFKNVKRRMELKGQVGEMQVYDDFAHHPTAIELTIQGLRKSVADAPIIAVVDARSNTMKMGHHREKVVPAMRLADVKIIHDPQHIDWLDNDSNSVEILDSIDRVIEAILENLQPNTKVLLMSNGAFGGIYTKLLERMQSLNS